MSRKSERARRPHSPLFDELVYAPDRERVPGARAVLSYGAQDDADFLACIDAVAGARVSLARRGHDHGAWAELDLRASGVDPTRPLAPEVEAERWSAARPIVLPGALAPVPDEEARAGLELYDAVDARALAAALARAHLGAASACAPPDERDLEKLVLPERGDVWVKSARLSLFEGDASRRLRVSFGEEVADDAARDCGRHRAVTAVAEALLPGAARRGGRALRARVERLLGGPALYTQHIAYWNAPQGGALFHHDAFDEEARGGQRGVLYVQLSGATAWLALSSADLAERVREFCEALEEGEADWVRKALWPDRRDFERALARTRDDAALARELALPGCGAFAALVNQGPDFTGFLADAGHGFLLRAGDALLMPNHGLERTVLHSVFCAADEVTYALSLALRDAGPES